LHRGVAVLVAGAALLLLPATGRANGDPASDYLLFQSVFLPFNAKIDSDAKDRLSGIIREADKAGFRIKVALIATPYDLGTAFSLYRKPQRYAEFLGLELSFVYRDRLLVVMPNGFGYAVNGKPAPDFGRALKGLAGPGRDVTKQAQAATVAVRRLAAMGGHTIVQPKNGSSEARDRITIAAAVVAGVALIAGVLLFQRQRRERPG
jgi:hypothetical protein